MPSPKITFHTLREEYTGRCLAEQVQQYLEEKLIILGKGANYGQVVFLAGGAGSGKGFAITNFLEGNKFKVFDPDGFKDAFLRIRDNFFKAEAEAERQSQKDGDHKFKPSQKTVDFIKGLVGLNLRDPKDTGKLHMMMKNLGVEEKKIVNFFGPGRQSGAGKVDPSTLPNVIFDNTMKDTGFLTGEKGQGGILDILFRLGYKSENIHIVWVLTDTKIAISQNFTRDRVVPTEILFQTHRGAAATMQDIMFKNYRSYGINGEIVVVLGGRGKVVKKKGDDWFDEKTGKTYVLDRDLEAPVVMDFKYFRLKKQGEGSIDKDAMMRVRGYILKYAPVRVSDSPEKLEKIAMGKLRKKGEMPSDVVQYMGKTPDPRDIEYVAKRKDKSVVGLARYLEKLGKSQGA